MDDWQPLLGPEEPASPVTEEFDPSWPYTFKYGVSRHGDTHVWRTHGGALDGPPTHRVELRERWGFEPKFGEGDRLGMAQYIPAERKLDGTLVAPPVILVHPYYDHPVPQSVIDWFEQQFPGTVVRQAVATRDMKGRPVKLAEWAPTFKLAGTLRWVWNAQDGLLVWLCDDHGQPTHDQKMKSEWGRYVKDKAGDYLGYADFEGDTIKIDPIRFSTPAQAIAAVKAEISKMYPDKHVVTDQDLGEQYGVEFHGDPGKIGRRMAAAEWAQKTLEVLSYDPLEGSVIDSQPRVEKSGLLGRIFPGKGTFTPALKNAGADMSGAMIALFIPEDAGKKLKVKGGEPLEMLHITLVYFQDKYADRDDWDEVAKVVEQIANQTPKMTGKVNGYGVFNNDEDVLWAVPSIQGLAALREKLAQAVEDAGFPVSKTYDWAPHITLKYDFKGKLPKVEEEISLDIPELTFAHGNNRDDFKFEGHFEKEAMAFDPEDWERVKQWSPYLYHATEAENVPGIFSRGLLPASEVGQSRDQGFWTPRPGHVYLFSDPNHAMESGRYQDLKTPILLQVRTDALDPNKLKADEDFLYANSWMPDDYYNEDEEGWRQDYGYGEPPLAQVWQPTLGDWAEQHGLDSPKVTFDSYDRHRTLAHEGPIHPSAISYAPQSSRQVAAGWGPQDWDGWQGTHRFVTDGKEVLTDPETGEIGGAGAHDLDTKFRQFYPDSVHLVHGWAVPTKDEMGYGIYAPHAGWGHPDEPGLHEIVHVLDKHLGKPTHFIESDNALYDKDRYTIYPTADALA